QDIPSLFARIIYMSSLRNSRHKYTESEFISAFDRGICHRIIEEAHSSTFRVWLSMDWRAKAADLKPYLLTLGFRGSPFRQSLPWNHLCEDIVPNDASVNEVQLFLSTVHTVVHVLADLERQIPST